MYLVANDHVENGREEIARAEVAEIIAWIELPLRCNRIDGLQQY